MFSRTNCSGDVCELLLAFGSEILLEYVEPSLIVRETIIRFLGTITFGFVVELPLLVKADDPKDSRRIITSD